MSEFVGSAMSVLEGVSQHPALLIEYNQIVMAEILPQLAALVACHNGEFFLVPVTMLVL